MSPMERTLKVLRDRGLLPWIVERSIPTRPFPTKQDFLHIIDVIAIDKKNTIGIQICGNDFKAHDRKICIEYRDNALEWLANPHRTLELWGWRQLLVKRGGKAKVWTPRVKRYTKELI